MEHITYHFRWKQYSRLKNLEPGLKKFQPGSLHNCAKWWPYLTWAWFLVHHTIHACSGLNAIIIKAHWVCWRQLSLTHLHTHTNADTHTHIHMHKCTDTHANIAHILMHMYTHTHSLCTYTHTHTNTHLVTVPSLSSQTCTPSLPPTSWSPLPSYPSTPHSLQNTSCPAYLHTLYAQLPDTLWGRREWWDWRNRNTGKRREKEAKEDKKERREEWGRGEDKEGRKREETCGGQIDSRVHVRPSGQMIFLHTPHLRLSSHSLNWWPKVFKSASCESVSV